MSIRRSAAALGCAAAAQAAQASFAQGSGWYAGGSIGRSAATIDNDRITGGLAAQGLATTGISDRDRDTGYKLFGGYQLNPNFAIEGGWFDMGSFGYTANTAPAGSLNGDVRIDGLNLDLVGTLPISERFSLLGRVGGVYARTRGTFAATGAVRMPYSATSTSERHAGYKFGAGVAWRMAEHWDLRAEVERMRIDDSVGNRGHVDFLGVSLVYRFGGPTVAPRAAAPATVVVAAPAPAPLPERAPAPIAVAPAPPAPPVTVHFSADALFGFDSSTLRPGATRELDALAADLRNVQYDSVRVVGHTDRLGAADYNQRLSDRRARTVAAYLVQAGLPEGRVSSSGMGEREALTTATECVGKKASPALVTCLQRDRRVDVQVEGRRSAVR